MNEADSRMGSAARGAWPVRPPILRLRPRPNLRPEALARILFGGSLLRPVLLPPSSDKHEIHGVRLLIVEQKIRRPISSLTLITRYLGGSLAMRVKSLASSLKVGLMFSSIIQPREEGGGIFQIGSVALVCRHPFKVTRHSHFTMTM